MNDRDKRDFNKWEASDKIDLARGYKIRKAMCDRCGVVASNKKMRCEYCGERLGEV